jgi:3-oxoacyl-[acyl-carrier-protein] synthase II
VSSEGLAVTGLGAVSPFGPSAASLWEGLLDGEACFSVPRHFDGAGRDRRVGVVPGDSPSEVGAATRTLDLGVRASRDALADADGPGGRLASVLGTTETANSAFSRSWLGGETTLSNIDAPDVLVADLAERLAHRLGVTVVAATTIANASASGAVILRVASDLVRSGACESALAVGADAVTETAFAGLASLRLLNGRGCRPFNRDRAGIRVSEAGAALVLEPLDEARRRGHRPRAVLRGCGLSNISTSPLRVASDSICRAVVAALDEAECGADDVGMINTHGTGTVQGDAAEISALRAVFGRRLRRIPVTSWKPSLGHCQGAAGAIEAVATVIAIEMGVIPCTRGLTAVDEEFSDLDLTPENRVWDDAHRVALSISCGFGGTTAALLFSEAEAAA